MTMTDGHQCGTFSNKGKQAYILKHLDAVNCLQDSVKYGFTEQKIVGRWLYLGCGVVTLNSWDLISSRNGTRSTSLKNMEESSYIISYFTIILK